MLNFGKVVIKKGIIAAVACFFVLPGYAQKVSRGIQGHQAPSWGVTQWINLPKETTQLDVSDLTGKIIYLYGFQSWCPGCHRHGFPTLQKMIERFDKDPKVAIVAIQTTFEGFHANGFEQAKQIAKRYQLTIPIGQSGSSEQRSEFMVRYRTGGTPWVIIIDREGKVRFNDFHVDPQQAMSLIEQLKRENEG